MVWFSHISLIYSSIVSYGQTSNFLKPFWLLFSHPWFDGGKREEEGGDGERGEEGKRREMGEEGE